MTGTYSFAIDRGGTFTDVIAQTPRGELIATKLLSEDPEHYPDAASEAVARILAQHGEAPIAELRIGTTIATNALLERKGERLALAITKGHGDALNIGNQARPDIFARHIIRPERLESRVIEIDERVDAHGNVLRNLDEDQARAGLSKLREQGIDALAIALMHGWKYSHHEQLLARIAQELGFTQISVSHEVAPLIRLIPRGDTTCADAYLSPVIRSYVEQLSARLPKTENLRFMQSNGGLARADSFRGKDAILSGPAGGVVGMVETGKALGITRLIGFDMGGTSTDVAHFAGEYERSSDSMIAGIRVSAPMMQIHTVAAGGGSICRFDGARLRVGPESAGAHPGPASYRKGGPLTLTDCNLVLGRIDPEHFPHVFGANGDEPLDLSAAQSRLEEVAGQLETPMETRELAEGFLAIAVDNMANAIRKISTARGHDVTTYALACFGGAGGQFACRVAQELGMDKVLIHPLAGMLSAYGIGLAPLVAMREASIVRPLNEPFADELETLGNQAREALLEQGLSADKITLIERMRLRFAGSDTTVELPLAVRDEVAAKFREEHRARFGWSDDIAPITLEALSVEAVGRNGGLDKYAPLLADETATASGEHIRPRSSLQLEESVQGPIMIADPGSTTIVEQGWSAQLAREGSLILTRAAATSQTSNRVAEKSATPDPIRLEIFNNLFMAIAEEMGVVLAATASSVNIKERLDFSCAVFDAKGALIANAPHIPVHLGSMGVSVEHVISRRINSARGIKRGDAFCLNDPYHGGTHLPDITVIMPVFYDAQSTAPDAYVAARGHHSDIGGIAPGSMPPNSTSIEQEGIRLDDILLLDEGQLRETEIRKLLAQGPYPARNPDQNIADLEAQLAACTRGSNLLSKAASEHTPQTLSAYMGHVMDNGEAAVSKLLSSLPEGEFSYAMDNGAQVCVKILIDRKAQEATFDFAGTSQQSPDNFNAPVAITRAAVLYSLRCLIDDAIPLNDGCLRPITIKIPRGCLLDPAPPAAIVAGNVETSQVITDAILAACDALAPAQGTMNNLTFGDQSRQYYETIAGGSGAGPNHAGTDAVQTHMTNSRLTDPEILETRFPVLVESFSIRQNSGGKGEFDGGNGVERRLKLLEPMDVQILANRRDIPPAGLAGGEPAQAGENWIERADGYTQRLKSSDGGQMLAGDTIIIKTPGGGGFGPPRKT